MKKILSLLLVLTMLFTLCPAAFAASPKTRELPFAGEYVTVSDDEGNVYTVWLKPNYIVLELLGVQMVLLVMVVTPKATKLNLLQKSAMTP